MIDPADIEAIAQRTAELVRGISPASMLTRKEAMRYVRRNSSSAFGEWCYRWGHRSESRNRHSKTRLDLALAREAGAARVPANLKRA